MGVSRAYCTPVQHCRAFTQGWDVSSGVGGLHLALVDIALYSCTISPAETLRLLVFHTFTNTWWCHSLL